MQDAVALAMEDTHTRHSHEDGIVDEISDGRQRLIATHTAHVEVLTEILPMVVDGVLGHMRYAERLQLIGQLIHLRLLSNARSTDARTVTRCTICRTTARCSTARLHDQLQPVERHIGVHITDGDDSVLAVDALEDALRLQALQLHRIADGQRTVDRRLLNRRLTTLGGFLRALGFALGFAAFAGLNLLHLLLEVLIGEQPGALALRLVLPTVVAHRLLERVELGAYLAGGLLLGLLLLDGAYGVLNAFVALAQQVLGLLTRLVEDGLTVARHIVDT